MNNYDLLQQLYKILKMKCQFKFLNSSFSYINLNV